jgi:hypothetical protein
MDHHLCRGARAAASTAGSPAAVRYSNPSSCCHGRLGGSGGRKIYAAATPQYVGRRGTDGGAVGDQWWRQVGRDHDPRRSAVSAAFCRGAVLTYAHRYTLFTLVGIAGEDDLDAPDLATPMKPGPACRAEKLKGRAGIGQTGRARIFPQ